MVDNIDKDQIAGLHFPPGEVLSSSEEIKQRKIDLEKGRFMNHGYGCKVLIHFKDATGLKSVQAGIGAIKDAKVLLDNGTYIPLHRIVKVKVFKESLKYPSRDIRIGA